MKKASIYLLSSLAFIFSCSKSTSEDIDVRELTSQKLELPEMNRPLDVNYIDSDDLFYVTEASNLNWISTFDNDGFFKGSFALKGEGPDEQLSSQKLQLMRLNSEGKQLILTDISKNSLFIYNKTNGNHTPNLQSITHISGHRLKSPILLSPNEFIDFNTDMSSSNLLVKFDSTGKVLKKSLHYPDSGFEMEDYLYQEAYSGYISYFPQDHIILVNLYFSDLLYLFNEELDLVATYQSDEPFYPRFKGIDNGSGGKAITPDFKNSKFGFLSLPVKLNNGNFLIGFSGEPAKGTESTTELFEFDQKLNLVGKYKLDQPVTRYTYSTKLNRIFAMTENYEGGFLVFDL